jgi:hypothetical protein
MVLLASLGSACLQSMAQVVVVLHNDIDDDNGNNK